MSQPLTLTLPWPPSVNTYWRRVNNRTILSAKAREYRANVTADAVAARRFGTARLAISIVASPPDRRARDLDNLSKGILDALAHAGVFADDSQVDDLRITRGSIVKAGRVTVTITEIKEEAA